jgi:hypothetical protein
LRIPRPYHQTCWKPRDDQYWRKLLEMRPSRIQNPKGS